MKQIYITNENELINAFNNNNPIRANQGDQIIIQKEISLHTDLVIDVPITILLDGGSLDTCGHTLTSR